MANLNHQGTRVATFETEIRMFLEGAGIPFEDFGSEWNKPDFFLEGKYYIEAKEKRQPINPKNWPILGDPTQVLILDELTARRMMTFVPFAVVAFRDNTDGTYYVTDIPSLWLMPRKRVNRNVEGKRYPKGKWLLYKGNFTQATGVGEIVDFVKAIDPRLFSIFSQCYGDFAGEIVATAGGIRWKGQENHDFAVTR